MRNQVFIFPTQGSQCFEPGEAVRHWGVSSCPPARGLGRSCKSNSPAAFRHPGMCPQSANAFPTRNYCSIFPCSLGGPICFSLPGLPHSPCTTWGRGNCQARLHSSVAISRHRKPRPCQMHIQYFHLVLSLITEPSSPVCAIRRFHQSEEVEKVGEDLDKLVLGGKRGRRSRKARKGC